MRRPTTFPAVAAPLQSTAAAIRSAGMSEPLTLAPESVEAVARRVAELLDGVTTISPRGEISPTASTDLVGATEIANRFNVSRAYVYEHATELGAVRLGSGPKARLRFNPDRVLEALSPQPFQTTTDAPTRRRGAARPQRRPPTELLPIGRQR